MSTFTIFLVLIAIVCFLLVVVIMVQNPKGGGLSSTLGGGGGQIGGVQKTSDFLDKSTWTLATVLIILVLLSSLSFTGTFADNGSKIIDRNAAPAPKTEAAPTATTPATDAPAATVQPTAADTAK